MSFFRDSGQIAAAAAGGLDNIIPLFLNTYLPEWFGAIFMIVLIAAGMSTLSSQFHAISTAFSHDLINTKNRSESQQVLINRIGVLLAFIVTFSLAYYLPQIWSGAIAQATAIFFGLCAASFLPMHTGALYSRRISCRAASTGMIAGFVVSLFGMIFVHFKTAAALGICKGIFQVDFLFKSSKVIPFIDPIVIALTISVLLPLLLTFTLKQDMKAKHIDRSFNGI